MAGYRYSLAHVKVQLTINNVTRSFGGQGSMIGSITLSRKNERFSSEGDPTGGYVVNETLDKTGTCVISIKQFAPLVSTLTNIFNGYDVATGFEFGEGNLTGENTLTDSTTINVYYMGALVATAKGCYLNMPELTMEEENGSRDFTFECGEVDFQMLDNNQAFEKLQS